MSGAASSGWRWAARVAGAAFGLTLLGGAVALATIDRWFFVALHPGTFDPAATPPAPDYRQVSAWAALPETDDAADVALPELPAAVAPVADVFYLHPTTSVGRAWNAPFDDPAVVAATERGGTLIQASAFNGCCAVYAPRYRQAGGAAFVRPDADGQRALDVAYADVSAAFDAFLARTGDRPFLLAGHSQGAVLGGRLLRERIAGSPLSDRLVAAWLPGAPLRDVGIPVCDTPTRTGCVASWHARGPGFTGSGFEFDADDPDTMRGRICVNPISWTSGADASRAVFFDAPEPRFKPDFARARCEDGTLVVTGLGDLERDLPSRVLLWMMGPENYHPIEYQLFYADIRENASARVAAFRR